MSQHSIICKNCENHYHGHYCNNCGQRAHTHRIDLKHLLHELFHALTHLDKGFLYTSKMMLSAPGQTIRDYLNGKRVRHSNPLLMLLIIGGLCSLTYYNLELKTVSAFKITDLDAGINMIDSKFFAILYLLYSLLFSFFDYILFRYKGYNYTELFTMNIFIASQILLALLALVPLWLLGKFLDINHHIRLIVGLIFMAYIILVRYQLFEVAGNVKARNRLILESFIFLLLFVFLSWKNLSNFQL